MPSTRALFEELVDLPKDEQGRRLAAVDPMVAATVRALLEADARPVRMLDVPVADAIAILQYEDEQLIRGLIGKRIGPFRILDVLGQGGTSVVYRAERPAGLGVQVVALKLLRTGVCSPDSQRRFLREQAILAQLSHPDIARLIEGGVSEAGIPYIAMELVEGTPITAAADERRLPLVERLKLFARLCRAVQAAHAALVVHCDLKPANVLVDDSGALKVLDFGVAKLLDSGSPAEQIGSLALTPEYAAPEQFLGEQVSVSVDVFALGLILGELVTGLRLSRDPPEAPSARLAREPHYESPPGLPARERLIRELRGDIDAIITTAIAAEASARYPSAESLARDVERLLGGFPLRARPPTRMRRAAMFVRRNRGFFAATAILATAMLGATAVAVTQGVKARREAVAAQSEKARSDSLRRLLFDAFEEAKPSVPRDGPVTIVEAMEKALAALAVERDVEPRIGLELQLQVARVLHEQGAQGRAADVLEDVRSRAARSFPDSDPLRLEIDYSAAKMTAERGDWNAAREQFDRLLARLPSTRDALGTSIVTTSAWLAGLMRDAERGQAESLAALKSARELGDARLVEQALRARGSVLLAFAQYEEAIRVYEDLLARQRAQYGDTHARVAAEEGGLSRAYRLAGRLEDAETHARAAIAIDDKVYAGDHWHKALHLNALAIVLREQRSFDEALPVTIEQLRIVDATLGAHHPDVIGTRMSLGSLYGLLSNWPESERWTRRALEEASEAGLAKSPIGIRTLTAHGLALAMTGAMDEAERTFQRALADATPDRDADVIAQVHERRTRVALDSGNLDKAARALAAFVEFQRPAPAGNRWEAALLALQGELLFRQGDARAALSMLAKAARANSELPSPDPVLAAHASILAALAARAAGDLERARASAATATNLVSGLRYPPRHVQRAAAELADLGL